MIVHDQHRKKPLTHCSDLHGTINLNKNFDCMRVLKTGQFVIQVKVGADLREALFEQCPPNPKVPLQPQWVALTDWHNISYNRNK